MQRESLLRKEKAIHQFYGGGSVQMGWESNSNDYGLMSSWSLVSSKIGQKCCMQNFNNYPFKSLEGIWLACESQKWQAIYSMLGIEQIMFV